MADLYALPRLELNDVMVFLDNRCSLPADPIQMELVVSLDEHHLNASLFRSTQKVSKGPKLSSEVLPIAKTEIKNVAIQDDIFNIIIEASESIHEQRASGIIEGPQMDVGRDDKLG